MDLLELLKRYKPLDAADAHQASRIQKFVESDPHCFERTNPIGHITGSAWIVDPSGERVLLTHHKKLNKWLQLGGHADGEKDIFAVALREAREESNLDELKPVTQEIFDLDVHVIPPYGSDPQHEHFDIRFAVKAGSTNVRASDESRDLAWVPIADLARFTSEESLLRMAHKWVKTLASLRRIDL